MIRIRLIVIESPRIVGYRFHGANYQLSASGRRSGAMALSQA